MVRPTDTKASASLAGISILRRLSAEVLAGVQQRCDFRRYGQGELIVDYLDQSDEVFFIICGEVRVTIYSLAGKVVSFRDLGSGEVFGEYPAIDRGPRSASVEARSSCLVAILPGAAFRELIEMEPVVALAMLPELVTKIRGLTTRIYEFSTLAVSNRIQAELLRLQRSAPGTDWVRGLPPPRPTLRSQAESAPTVRQLPESFRASHAWA
jgi:CRP/FNR family transcriptional regulator, cyclic AMP receptor protein